jgi:hypothetical protein
MNKLPKPSDSKFQNFIRVCLLFGIMATGYSSGFAQLSKVHSPNKAAIYSAVLPGLGQAYNKKYWKIPVVYAGFGTMAYFINSNAIEYNKFRNAYDYKTSTNPDPSKYNEYVNKYPEASLLQGRDYYRRNRDLSYILTGVWYLLNVVDAAVDAYLFDYDVSEDLTLHIRPDIMYIQSQIVTPYQLKVSLSF